MTEGRDVVSAVAVRRARGRDSLAPKKAPAWNTLTCHGKQVGQQIIDVCWRRSAGRGSIDGTARGGENQTHDVGGDGRALGGAEQVESKVTLEGEA